MIYAQPIERVAQIIDQIDSCQSLRELKRLQESIPLIYSTIILRVAFRNKLSTHWHLYFGSITFESFADLELPALIHNFSLFSERILDSIKSFVNSYELKTTADLENARKIINCIEQHFEYLDITEMKQKYQQFGILPISLVELNPVGIKRGYAFVSRMKSDDKSCFKQQIWLDVSVGKLSNQEIIIKKYYGLNRLGDIPVQAFKKEAEFMQQLSAKKKCFLTFYGVIITAETFELLMESCGSSLDNEIIKNHKRGIRLTNKEFFYICLELLDGLEYMEQNNMCHRDIKPSNIFYNGFDIKIADFSISDYKTAIELGVRSVPGTKDYMAPELLSSRDSNFRYDPIKSDMYSLGLTLLEVLISQKLQKDRINQYLSQLLSGWAKELLTSMLQNDPLMRPTFSAALKKLKEAAAEVFGTVSTSAIP